MASPLLGVGSAHWTYPAATDVFMVSLRARSHPTGAAMSPRSLTRPVARGQRCAAGTDLDPGDRRSDRGRRSRSERPGGAAVGGPAGSPPGAARRVGGDERSRLLQVVGAAWPVVRSKPDPLPHRPALAGIEGPSPPVGEERRHPLFGQLDDQVVVTDEGEEAARRLEAR